MSQRGSIHRRGDTWTVRWRTDTAEGRKHHSKGGFRTKKEAQDFLTDVMAALRGGVFAEPTKVTVGDFLTERWLPARQLSLRPSTYASYQTAINCHVVPELGHIQIQQLSPDRLDRFYADLVASGLSAKTVRNIHALLHKALRDAVRKNLVPRNAADAADPPKLARANGEEMKTWTPAQLRVFFDGIAGHRLAPAYLLAATTGMRRGEVLGVRWRDISFPARRLHVRQTILSVNYQVTVGQPKTRRGERKISLDAATIEVLRAHRTAQRRERHLLGDGYRDQDLVFARPDGSPIHPDYFSQTFDRTVKRLELPKIRLHDLRHTHATLGLGAGVPVKIISDRLGHATTSFTMDVYMHAIPAAEDDAADQIADLMFGRDDEAESDDSDADEGPVGQGGDA
ncbi:MAG: site-specific integrase [Acidimicrobiia bacterium]|nr:site-specific integrase [Acidimicrobiia bacterium]